MGCVCITGDTLPAGAKVVRTVKLLDEGQILNAMEKMAIWGAALLAECRTGSGVITASNIDRFWPITYFSDRED